MINKKTVMIVALVFMLILQTGCSGKQNEERKQDLITEENHDQTKDIMAQFHTSIEQNIELEKMIIFINENISVVSQEDASIMIDQLEKAQKENLVTLEDQFYQAENMQNKFMDLHMLGSDINKIDGIEDKELKSFLVGIKDKGYKVETAERMYFPVINYEFYEPYRSEVTPDIKDYIDLMVTESNEVPAKDAALVIGWDKIIDRALNQEQFINQYPDSPKIGDVQALYQKYVTFVLYGLNNTPLFNYDSKMIEEDAKKTYIEAIEGSNDSQFLDIIKEFMDTLKENNYKLTDEVDQYRKKLIEGII